MTRRVVGKGLLPHEYRRRSPVEVERVRGPGEAKLYGDEDLYAHDVYLVHTRRVDGQWSHVVELKGTVTMIPDKVFVRMLAHRQAIIKEAAKRRGAEQAIRMRRVQKDQSDADLVGPFKIG